MTLKERIQGELVEALRQHDGARATLLRQLKAAIRNAEIDQQGELDDSAVLAVLDKAAKQHRESIAAYREGGRADLVAAEEVELRLIEAYLPRQMDEVEVRAAVSQAVAELGAQGPADMGRVIRLVLDQHKGRVDGKVVSNLVREALAGTKQ